MFDALFLLTLLPSWVVVMGMLLVLRRRQQDLEESRAVVPAPVKPSDRR